MSTTSPTSDLSKNSGQQLHVELPGSHGSETARVSTEPSHEQSSPVRKRKRSASPDLMNGSGSDFSMASCLKRIRTAEVRSFRNILQSFAGTFDINPSGQTCQVDGSLSNQNQATEENTTPVAMPQPIGTSFVHDCVGVYHRVDDRRCFVMHFETIIEPLWWVERKGEDYIEMKVDEEAVEAAVESRLEEEAQTQNWPHVDPETARDGLVICCGNPLRSSKAVIRAVTRWFTGQPTVRPQDWDTERVKMASETAMGHLITGFVVEFNPQGEEVFHWLHGTDKLDQDNQPSRKDFWDDNGTKWEKVDQSKEGTGKWLVKQIH